MSQHELRDRAVAAARSLRSETGENPEYDRALVEVLSDIFGGTREEIASEIGVLRAPNPLYRVTVVIYSLQPFKDNAEEPVEQLLERAISGTGTIAYRGTGGQITEAVTAHDQAAADYLGWIPSPWE